MNRRNFLKTSIILASSNNILDSKPPINSQKDKKNFISGFIFSDAHIGWKGADQPSIDLQIKAINVIKNKFPNIDLVFDTGDIHHGYLNEVERNIARHQWLSYFSNPFFKPLFHYIPGNHELGKGPNDEELTASKIGSNNFRPYYSFDYKGIHFISLPQLLDTILINRESIDWLRHDLKINKNKSTMIFSHNSVKGTTYDNGENGYRTIVNSDVLLNTINEHKNVIAWLHGHNHQYEIVNKHNRLYVSNGRIGGFNPPKGWGPFGQGHLGGVYFEINSAGLLVKCFSASKNVFLEQANYPNLSNSLKLKTTFNNNLGMNYYFGHGALTDNVTHEIFNHYLSDKNIQLELNELKSSTLNDNSNFELTTELFFIGKRINRLIGYQLLPKNLKRKSVNDGLLVENPSEGFIQINLPTIKKTKLNYMVRASYYRCESLDCFRAVLSYDNLIEDRSVLDTKIKITFFVFNNSQKVIYQSESFNMIKDKNTFSTEQIKIPEIGSDCEKYLRVSFTLKHFPKKFILSKLTLSKQSSYNSEPCVYINSKKFNFKENKVVVKKNLFYMNGESSNMRYNGKKPASCIIKIENVKWQIRNAISTLENNCIFLYRYRHAFQKPNEVILTPVNHIKNYLYKVVELMPLRISYDVKTIKISLVSINPNSKLFFYIESKPKKLFGSTQYSYNKNLLTLIPETKNIHLFF